MKMAVFIFPILLLGGCRRPEAKFPSEANYLSHHQCRRVGVADGKTGFTVTRADGGKFVLADPIIGKGEPVYFCDDKEIRVWFK